MELIQFHKNLNTKSIYIKNLNLFCTFSAYNLYICLSVCLQPITVKTALNIFVGPHMIPELIRIEKFALTNLNFSKSTKEIDKRATILT